MEIPCEDSRGRERDSQEFNVFSQWAVRPHCYTSLNGDLIYWYYDQTMDHDYHINNEIYVILGMLNADTLVFKMFMTRTQRLQTQGEIKLGRITTNTNVTFS